MKPKYVLTKWQRRQRDLFEEALLNPDLYQEMGFLRRDFYSPIEYPNKEEYLLERVLRLMDKFSLELPIYEVILRSCRQGGEFDYSLISRKDSTNTNKAAKIRPSAKLYHEAYNLWSQQRKTVTEVTYILQKKGYKDMDVQYAAKIIKRMIARDPNRSKNRGPNSGRRLSAEEKRKLLSTDLDS